MSRASCEFSQKVKQEAKRRYYENNPGSELVNLEVHHKVSIKAGRQLGIPKHILKSQENAIALPDYEHEEYHRNEPTLEEYAIIAQGLLGITQIELDLL